MGHKYLENFDRRCWRRMEQINWANDVKNYEVLHIFKEETNVIHIVKRRKDY
jgi:hypothetical protein